MDPIVPPAAPTGVGSLPVPSNPPTFSDLGNACIIKEKMIQDVYRNNQTIPVATATYVGKVVKHEHEILQRCLPANQLNDELAQTIRRAVEDGMAPLQQKLSRIETLAAKTWRAIAIEHNRGLAMGTSTKLKEVPNELGEMPSDSPLGLPPILKLTGAGSLNVMTRVNLDNYLNFYGLEVPELATNPVRAAAIKEEIGQTAG